jgi:ADP-dependent NAD(P)H-hydrate dehydratase
VSAIPLDTGWLDAHPLPRHLGEIDKNSRGRVLLAGGAAMVPGALRLTGEAALRAGAGKLQMATVESVALPLGMLVPEAAAIGLPEEDGEIGIKAVPLLRSAMERCDTFILGPGMGDCDRAAALVEGLLGEAREGMSVLLDAAAIACADRLHAMLQRHDGRLVLTPHHGEMAKLAGCEATAIAADPRGAAHEAAQRCGGVVAL